MTRVGIYTLLGIFLLFAVMLMAKENITANRGVKIAGAQTSTDPMGCTDYNYQNMKQSVSSFDLANGLTKNDFISLSYKTSLSFYYLIACLWLVAGLRLKFKRPLKPGQSG
ncbi:MAG TPA: hypothetical protein VE082_02005 [Desulfobaccales bacterium]|nr:hypothetical protein [Desulfobaccales bacterium]